jgi:hypothetical protein
MKPVTHLLRRALKLCPRMLGMLQQRCSPLQQGGRLIMKQ